jgi:hypothetical protein
VKCRYWGFLGVYRLLMIPRNLLMELVAGSGFETDLWVYEINGI